MPRFFIDETPQGDTVALHGENAHHAGRVLRLRPGEALTLCDGAGTDFETKIVAKINAPKILKKELLFRER